jgi:hypothetical protein
MYGFNVRYVYDPEFLLLRIPQSGRGAKEGPLPYPRWRAYPPRKSIWTRRSGSPTSASLPSSTPPHRQNANPSVEQFPFDRAPPRQLPQRRPESAQDVEASILTRKGHHEGDAVMLRRRIESACARGCRLDWTRSAQQRHGSTLPHLQSSRPRLS